MAREPLPSVEPGPPVIQIGMTRLIPGNRELAANLAPPLALLLRLATAQKKQRSGKNPRRNLLI